MPSAISFVSFFFPWPKDQFILLGTFSWQGKEKVFNLFSTRYFIMDLNNLPIENVA